MLGFVIGQNCHNNRGAFHHSRLFVIALVHTVLVFGIQVLAVMAQADSLRVHSLEQHDLNGDSAANVTIIDTAFATERDRVLVIDRKGDMPWGIEWQEVTDFRDDVWVFDVGADGTAQLIVAFEIEGDQHVAMIYDDVDGDGIVSYHLDGSQIVIEESDFWYAKVIAGRYWTEYDTLPHKNVTILVDGSPPSYRGNNSVAQVAEQDGAIDWEYNIGDKDGDGINDYQLAYALSQSLRSSGYVEHKAAILAQVEDSRPSPYSDTVFWPMLKSKHASGNYRYFDHPPVVTVDWEKGRVNALGVLGFPIEAGYHIFSRVPLTKNTINALNWENPIAYYNLANDQNGRGELAVRFDVIVPFDPIFGGPAYAGKIATPSVEVNYTWDQNNDNRMDYKMNLAANYPVEEVVEFPDFAVKSIPYDEIVPWVRDKTWDVAMLVHHVEGTTDGEAMYGQGWLIERGYQDGSFVAPTGLQSRYLRGLSDRYPIERYQDIDEGLRGEYNFEYFDTPGIYLSALDRQFHLRNAQGGVWNMGGGRYIRYANLKGDAYLDQWREEQDGAVVQQVNYGYGVYVHSGNGRVKIKHTRAGPAVFEAQPPGSYEEWQRLDAQLQASQIDLAPGDFAGMIDLLPGPAMEIHGANVTGFRPTSQGGFRFLIEMYPGYQVSGLDLLGMHQLMPGEYVVQYHEGLYSISPPLPPQLNLATKSIYTSGADSAIRVTVQNDGNTDQHGLTLIAELASDGGPSVGLTRKQLDALAGEETEVMVAVPAAVTVQQVLAVRIEDGENNVVASYSRSLASSKPGVTENREILAQSSAQQSPVMIAGLLLGIALSMSLAMALILRPASSTGR